MKPVGAIPMRVSVGRPITGARIETFTAEEQIAARSVAPSQGRGLKHMHAGDMEIAKRSPHHRGAD